MSIVRNDSVTVTVLNWNLYNGRKDIVRPSWFRLEYRLVENPDFYDFTHEEFKAWIYILSQACRLNNGTVTIRYSHAKGTARITKAGIDGCIRKLLQLQEPPVYVTCQSRASDVTGQDRTEQDRTDESSMSGTATCGSRTCGCIPDLSGDQPGVMNEMLETVTHSAQRAWLKLYPADWIRKEILKARAWLEVNPQRRPKKQMGRFIGSWLNRGWERHRKQQPVTGRSFTPFSDEDMEYVTGKKKGDRT